MNEIESTVISSRLRLARNIDGFPFPHKLDMPSAHKITDSVSHALAPVDNFAHYNMHALSPLERNILLEKHLISPDLIQNSMISSVLISPDEAVSIMINEEDHIREQVILPGLSLDRAYDRVNGIDNILAKSVKIAFSEQFGYLTACATNLGTGMRASVMMFLPALAMANLIDTCVSEVVRLNMTVRGVYGEGSNAEGYFYQVSNQRTLGMSEGDIIDSVNTAIKRIAQAELRARDLLRNDAKIKDKIFRAYGVVTNAYTLSTSEAMEYLGMVRLGAYYGYISLRDRDEFEKMTTQCKPASIQKLGGKNMSDAERDILRARYVASVLGNIAQKTN